MNHKICVKKKSVFKFTKKMENKVMNFWKCWEYGWIKTVVNQIRKTVKFKLKTSYQEILKRIENHENTENLNDLKNLK